MKKQKGVTLLESMLTLALISGGIYNTIDMANDAEKAVYEFTELQKQQIAEIRNLTLKECN